MKSTPVASPSDGLRTLASEHEQFLKQQTGSHGECLDCGKDIPRTQLCVTCPCHRQIVCIKCLDSHERERQRRAEEQA